MPQTSAVDHMDSLSDTGGNNSQANGPSGGPTLGAVCNTGQNISSSGSVNAVDSVAHGANSSAKESPVITNDAKENYAGLGNPAYHSTSGSANDSSVHGNGESHAGDGAPVTITEHGADGIGSAALHQLPPPSSPGLSAEEERLWGIVTVNSLDFGAWTALIEETERALEGNILKIRKVYDTFLAEFPLCYGYWKKYADHEARLSGVDKVAEVYERAVQGVTYSVDIWAHYCAFAIGAYGDPDTIRRAHEVLQYTIAALKMSHNKAKMACMTPPLTSCVRFICGRLFERALDYVGTDYLCFPLWDKYIEYEISQEDWPRVATIYTRVLEVPNQQLDRYFEGFKELVANRPLSELRTAEEVAATNSDGAGHENEGELHPNAGEQSSKALKDAEELEKYIAIREEVYKKAKHFDSKIIGFESAIRRPYFHVRPLNVAELENWHNYLDFIEAEGEFNKVVKLYERCLIACANYPEYWIRYILCMETIDRMDLVENVLVRATQVFVKRQPEIHLFAARFKEQHGDIAGARAAYQLVHTEISPGLLEAVIKHANMERRLGKLQDACSLYEHAIAIEKGKEQSQTLSFLFAQYSRFMLLVSGNVEKAREILAQGVESAQLSKPLLEAMIHFESIQPLPKQVEYLDSLVEKFIVPNPESSSVANVDEREEVSSVFLEFLNIFGDVQSVKKADDRHAKLFLHRKSTAASKKRNADHYLTSDRAKVTISVSSTSNPSVMGVYPGTQNQWAAGYGVQTQTWPQASQPQAQQWGPGYSQQAAYGAYGYAAGYTHPQAPVSVPQNATYGTYPPTYPTQQVFPQQTYAQPAPTAALNMAQQLPNAAAPPATHYTTSYY